MGDLIRAVATHPWAAIWVYLAFMFTLSFVMSQIRPIKVMFYVFHKKVEDIETENRT